MKLELEVRGAPLTVSTDGRLVPGPLVVRAGDEERLVEVLSVAEDEVVLAVDGRRLRVALARSAAGTWASVSGRARLVVETGARRGRTGPAEDEGAVSPPFPATVVKVLVAEGDEVSKGQPLVLVTAMKTEMTLRAPHAGVVRAVSAAEGASVGPGDVLVEIEERGQSDG